MNAEEQKRWVASFNEEALLCTGLEDALIGVAERCSKQPLAVYDAQKCIEILARGGMTEEEADEFFWFNTLGAWAGEGTPLFLWRTPEAGELDEGQAKSEASNL